ncbi:hypothetical protein GWK47_034462 [Chionoecetes opilio]|uniref:Uncharacterized protein n=1 Tax=Chionoecetes opilio TaxID=41210 RepID=A0A8J5CZY2_CHIOP|nr:hypothetical protein GWK47_034462 [Chionoecetes opilio]
MSDTSPGIGAAMNVQVDDASFPPLPSTASKRARAHSPSQEGPDKAPRTGQDSQPPPDACVQASYLLRAASGARVFANPSKVSHALHLSPLGKYVLEGETRSLGNGSAFIVVVWEHNISIPQGCVLGAPLPPPSAPLPWVPSDRPLPQHLPVPGAMLPLQRASPMQARRHHLHQALPLFPEWGGPDGPRSAHCPFNCRAQQLYADLAREGKPLHAINTQLRDLDLPSLPAHRRPRPSPPTPAPAKPDLPPATAVHPVVQYSTWNRFGPLQEALEDDASLPQDPVISPEPGSTPLPLVRRRNHLRKPRRPPGYQAPPSTPTPSDLDSGFTYSTIADMALTFLLWNARSLLRKSSELYTYLQDSLPSVVGLCETWLPPHLKLNLPGYSILRRDRQQGRGGGVLLALQNVLLHSPLPLLQWPGGHLEVVAARDVEASTGDRCLDVGELYALHQAVTHLPTSHSKGKAVIYTDSPRHPSLCRSPAVKRLIFRVCRSTWNITLGDALRITSMGQYRSDSSPQPWILKKSRVTRPGCHPHLPPPGAH